MKTFAVGYLAGLLVLGAFSAPAWATAVTEGVIVVAGPSGSNMTIYTVPPLSAPVVAAASPSVAPVIVNIIFYKRSLRHVRYHRAFGHRYTGFVKMYSGNPYPF
jgi:hypothetical protein